MASYLISMCLIIALFALLNAAFVEAIISFPDGTDLATYVSRPDIKPPIFNVTVDDISRVSPGYWFLATYIDLESPPIRAYTPHQIGPHIFDNKGNLVWSGSDMFGDRTITDFKVALYDDSPHLSLIVMPSDERKYNKEGGGFILDNSYAIRSNMSLSKIPRLLDMHEFNVINQGQSALLITAMPTYYNRSEPDTTQPGRWIGDTGFQEVNIATNEVIFDWKSLDHIQPWESMTRPPKMPGTFNKPWDYLHLNSVDKNADGDYLISGRYTDCIYKVSGLDGHIIWRLGGKNSSFLLDGFNFSWQHDARFQEENTTHTTISFLNNAASQFSSTANYSSAMVVSLQTSTTPMVATLIKQFDRPDRQLTSLRGNVQILPNRNTFVGWSANGYISEFTEDGRCVLEARFLSSRFTTYRAYKFNFTGVPLEPPAMKAHAYGVSNSTTFTVFHVSWNGATEVVSWKFYGSGSSDSEAKSVLGESMKTGFETTFAAAGYVACSWAEGVAANGSVLGRSPVTTTVVPPGSPILFTNSVGCPTVDSAETDLYQYGSNKDPSGVQILQFSAGNLVIVLIFLVGALSFLAWLLAMCYGRKISSATQYTFLG